MLDTLLFIVLQSYGQLRRPDRSYGQEGQEEHVIARTIDEEVTEMLRFLNAFTERAATPDPQN